MGRLNRQRMEDMANINVIYNRAYEIYNQAGQTEMREFLNDMVKAENLGFYEAQDMAEEIMIDWLYRLSNRG